MGFKDLIKGFSQEVEQFPWEDADFYQNYLAQTYFYVRQSTRLLSLAASRFSLSHEQHHRRFLKHCSEEASHERLAVADLKKMGQDIENFEEFPSTRSFYEVQFAKVYAGYPFDVYGYILALEGLAVQSGDRILRRVDSSHPKGANSFVRVHASEDPEHLQKAFESLENLNRDKLDRITISFHQTTLLFNTLLKACHKTKTGHLRLVA